MYPITICVFQDFDAWFNTNSCLENTDLVERLHAVSTNYEIVYKIRPPLM